MCLWRLIQLCASFCYIAYVADIAYSILTDSLPYEQVIEIIRLVLIDVRGISLATQLKWFIIFT